MNSLERPVIATKRTCFDRLCGNAASLWKCRVFVVFLSREFHKSKWCLKELYTALYRHRGKDNHDFLVRMVFCEGMDPDICDVMPAYAGLKLGQTFGTLYKPYTTLEGFVVHCLHPTIRQLLSGNNASMVPDSVFTEKWRIHCPLKPPKYLETVPSNLDEESYPSRPSNMEHRFFDEATQEGPYDSDMNIPWHSTRNEIHAKFNAESSEKDEPNGSDVVSVCSWASTRTVSVLVASFALILFGAIVIGILVPFNRSVDDDTQTSLRPVTSITPTQSPSHVSSLPSSLPSSFPSSTPTETPSPTEDPRTMDILTLIQSHTLVQPLALRYPLDLDEHPSATPEEKALTWLIDEDLAKLGVQTPSGQLRTLQRYALATLWFLQTPERPWKEKDQVNWLSEANECDWAMVTCREKMTMTNAQGSSNDTERVVDRLGVTAQKLQGPPPQDLGLLSNLSWLDLKGNELSGSFPSFILRLTGLAFLDLAGNQFTGPIPDEIGTLTQLQELRLWSNSFTGTLPPTIGELSNLFYINVGTNPSLGGHLPSSVTKCTMLKEMVLWFSNFTGPIPDDIGNLVELENLLLSGNSLSGTIPDSFDQLVNLVVFMAEGNGNLGGPLPSNLPELSRLSHVWLEGNRFTGTIPNGIGRLTNLKFWMLQNNLLKGTIPSSVGQLSQLFEWDVGNNPGLWGPIPTSLSDLEDWRIFNIHSTSLTGKVPLCGVYGQRQYTTVAADCNKVQCPCCTHCCDGVPGTKSHSWNHVCGKVED